MNKFDETRFQNITDLSNANILEAFIQRLGIESKIWLKLENGDYLFKIDGRFQQGFYEMIVSKVCSMIDVDCVNAYPAVFNGNKALKNKTASIFYTFAGKEEMAGVIVESYLENEKAVYLNLDDLYKRHNHNRYKNFEGRYSVKETTFALDKLRQEGYQIDFDIVEKLKKICLCDYLFCQTDRHGGNIEISFCKDDGKCSVKLAPMFDNGRCLGYSCHDKREVLKMCKKDCQKFVVELDDYDFLSGKDKKTPTGKRLAREILSDSALKQTYNKLTSLNFEQIVGEVANIYPTAIDKSQQNLAILTFKTRLAMLEKFIKKERLRNDNGFEKIIKKLLNKKFNKDCDEKELI